MNSTYLHGKVTFSRKVKRWILGVLGSSTRMSFLAPNHVFFGWFLGMEALNVRLAALNLRRISRGVSWWSWAGSWDSEIPCFHLIHVFLTSYLNVTFLCNSVRFNVDDGHVRS